MEDEEKSKGGIGMGAWGRGGVGEKVDDGS